MEIKSNETKSTFKIQITRQQSRTRISKFLKNGSLNDFSKKHTRFLSIFTNQKVQLDIQIFSLPKGRSQDCRAVTVECFEEHTDYPGHDLDYFYSENPQKCQIACQELENCHFWTYVESGSKCYRKSIKENVNQHSSATSGPKYCEPGNEGLVI